MNNFNEKWNNNKIFVYICRRKNNYSVCKYMNKNSFLYRVYDLYVDGFRNMTIGRTLWAVIIVKLIIMFLVLKLFFFPDFLKQQAKDGDKASFVSKEMIDRRSSE